MNETISISIKRDDVADVNCKHPDGINRDFMWVMGESKTTIGEYPTRMTRPLKIRGASIKATQSIFTCRPEIYENTICCRVIAKIRLNNVTSANATTTIEQEIHTSSVSSSANVLSATATPVITSQAAQISSLYETSFPNVTPGAFTSFRTATISATVSASAVLLLSVGAAAIIALKRKQLSGEFTANDSSDYFLDVKEQQIWNGSKIIPIKCLLIGKSLGERNIDNCLEKLQN